jgi:hypothetical protein
MLLCGLASIVYLAAVPWVSVAELRTSVPFGTPRAEVEVWLHNKGIGWLNVSEGSGADRKIVGLAGWIDAYRIQIPFATRVIDFEFLFDDQNELREIYAEEFELGL